MSSIFR